MSASETFGEKLRELRERAGLTQAELAEKLQTTQMIVSRWERGGRVPTWSAIQKLADALGVSTEAFRDDAPAPADDV